MPPKGEKMSNPSLQVNFSANTAGFSQGMSQLRQKLLELNTRMEENRQKIREANAQIREYEKELRQLRTATQNGTTATAEQQARMQTLRDRIAQTSAQLGVLRTTEQDLQGSIRSANAEIQNQEKGLQAVTSGAASMGDVLRANLWSSAIQSAVRKLTSSLKGIAQHCYNVGTSFESGMSQVKAISGASGEELEQLTQRAKDLGAQTKFTASQAADAMNYMAMAGWNAQQMLDGIDGVMSLAAASGEDLAQVSDIVTDAITAFGLKAEDVAHFSDVLAASSAASNTNAAMMGETFQYCATIAGALGFSIEDVTEAIGIMANSGVKSSMAGTALRTLFTNLSQEVKLSGQRLGEVTVRTANADGSMRSLRDILADLREAFSQLTDSEKSVQAEAVAGKYAMSGFLALMNAGEGDVDKLRSAIEECDGASAQMADTMQNNTAGAVVIMQSALEGLGIAVYEKFGEQLRDDVNDLTDVFSVLRERIESGSLDEVFDRAARSVGKAADQLVDFAAEALPAAIEGIANIITFFVEYRSVILGVVTAIASYKAVSAIGSLMAGFAGSIRGVVASLTHQAAATVTATAATQGYTAAQIAANTAAAANPYVMLASAVVALGVGLAALIASSNSTAESFEELSRKAEELNEAAEQSAAAAEDVHKLVDEYHNIKKAADDTEEAKQRLSEIQDTLVDTYGAEADKLDLVNGKYEEQLLLLQNIADSKDKAAEYSVRAAYYADAAAQRAHTLADGEVVDSLLSISDGNARQALFDSLVNIAGRHGVDFSSWRMDDNVSFETTAAIWKDLLDENLEIFEGSTLTDGKGIADFYGKLYNDYLKMTAAAEQLEHNKKLYDELSAGEPAAVSESTSGSFTAGSWMMKEYSEKGLAQQAEYKAQRNRLTGVNWDDYDEIKKYLQYLRDVEEITESQYYDKLEEHANKLLDRNSEKWRSAMSEIYKGRKKGGSGGVADGDEYDSEKKYLKWRLDMGYITEADYYRKLAQLRDRYLDESSDKWRQATLGKR